MTHEAPQFNPDSLEEERARLDTIKAEYAGVLSEKCITYKALAVVPELNPEQVLEVAVTSRPTDSEDEVETGIMFYSIAQEPSSQPTIESYFIPVAKWTYAHVELEHGFTLDDFEIVEGFAHELRMSREWGELPHLSDDLLSIYEPQVPNSLLDD